MEYGNLLYIIVRIIGSLVGVLMSVAIFVVSIFLSLFSTVVMSYVSLAIPVGPWIASTLVLIALLLAKITTRSGQEQNKFVIYAVTSGSLGGIIAVACGFSYPTLYFLDKQLFTQWLESPIYFIGMLSWLVCAAGLCGIWLANVVEKQLICEEKLPFPIGQLIHKMIVAHQQVRKSWELVIGFTSTVLFLIAQDGLLVTIGTLVLRIPAYIPNTLTLISPLSLRLMPMLFAIGFIAGHVIAIPLMVGVFTSICITEPLNRLYFSALSQDEFILTFGSGLIVSGAFAGFMSMPKQLWQGAKKFFNNKSRLSHPENTGLQVSNLFMGDFLNKTVLGELAGVIIISGGLLLYVGFSYLGLLYTLFFSLLCGYQVVVLAGKTGLAFLGRFATFVMVPGMMIFGLNAVQVTILATFVELVGGVATDVLFGRTVAYLNNDTHMLREVRKYQYFGLLVSGLSIGVVFWLLINHFGLGSAQLIAQRAQGRALLVQTLSSGTQTFSYAVLLWGFVYGILIKKLGINSMLVFGGLLMRIDFSLSLIIGGLLTYCVKDKEYWFPLCSGIFAANSIWMLLKAVCSFYSLF